MTINIKEIKVEKVQCYIEIKKMKINKSKKKQIKV